jgi:hypothetical protein
MQSELSRLVIGQWFLSAFYRLAKSEGVHVHFSESLILDDVVVTAHWQAVNIFLQTLLSPRPSWGWRTNLP